MAETLKCEFISSECCLKAFLISSDKADVHAGSLNPRLLTVTERKINKIIFHPLYDNISQYFDLSLLVLNEVNTFFGTSYFNE